MKKILLFAAFAAAVLCTGCKKNDPIAPLVTGNYTWTNSKGVADPISIEKVEGTENKFVVYNLGIVDYTGWNAEYNTTTNELVLDGTVNGEEEEGNLFAEQIGWFNQAQNWVYGVACFDTKDSQGKGKDNLRFAVDPATGKVQSQLSYQYQVVVVNASTGESVGAYAIYQEGAAVTFVPEATAPARASKNTFTLIEKGLRKAAPAVILSEDNMLE